MSKATDLTIEVTAKTTIDRESAERCLKMVEWYCNDNNELMLMGDRDNDGRIHFYFKRAGSKERERSEE